MSDCEGSPDNFSEKPMLNFFSGGWMMARTATTTVAALVSCVAGI